MPTHDSSQDPRLTSQTSYFIKESEPLVILASDWSGYASVGERIEQVHETVENAKAALHDLHAPIRAKQAEFEQLLNEWKDQD